MPGSIIRRTVVAAVAAIGVAGSLLLGAGPAEAAYQDPLTRGDLVTYNHHDYRLSIAPVAGAKRVVRSGHAVAATYTARMTEPGKSKDTVVWSGVLGYSRTAYLRIKTVSVDTVRSYGLTAYLKKVTGFSAAYAAKRVEAFTVEYRHRTLRGDVAATIPGVKTYIAAHGTAEGIERRTELIVKSDGFFGYGRALFHLYPANAYQDGAGADDFIVSAFDPADGYQVVYSSWTGRTRTATTEDSLALLA